MTTNSHDGPAPATPTNVVPRQRTHDDDRTVEITRRLANFRSRLDTVRPTNIGFPTTLDLDLTPLWPFFNDALNNVGDPDRPSVFPAHSNEFETDVIDIVADLVRAPSDDRWGYVTTGGTEGIEYGLWLARTIHPDTLVYYPVSAHWAVPKVIGRLRMPAVPIRACRDGRMDLRDLRRMLYRHRDQPATILATVGTTLTEAIDNVIDIRQVLAETPQPRAYVHADAALSGLPLALLPSDPRPGFDLADGADSISISGHKFLGSPMPSGFLITRRSLKMRLGGSVELLGTHDTTIGGSRSGHAPLILWYAIHHHGLHGLRERVRHARGVAQYTVDTLTALGWSAWRHQHAMTVVLETPPPRALAARWAIPTSHGRAHIVCMPQITTEVIDQFAAELGGSSGQTGSSSEPTRRRVPMIAGAGS